MSESPTNPWIHIGECPVCVNGLGRVRTCGDESSVHFYAVCDECEATWKEPDLASKRDFANAEEPLCPVCSAAMYGKQSHWSLVSEIEGTTWDENAIIEPNNAIIDLPVPQAGAESSNAEDDSVDMEDERGPGC